MTFSPKIKIASGLLVVFAAGAILGGWGYATYSERIFLRFIDNRTWSPTVLNGLDAELKLSAEQKGAAQKLIDHTVSVVTKDFSHMGEELVRLHLRLQSILTPEQQAKNKKGFEAFRVQLQRKFNITLPPEVEDRAANPASSVVSPGPEK